MGAGQACSRITDAASPKALRGTSPRIEGVSLTRNFVETAIEDRNAVVQVLLLNIDQEAPIAMIENVQVWRREMDTGSIERRL